MVQGPSILEKSRHVSGSFRSYATVSESGLSDAPHSMGRLEEFHEEDQPAGRLCASHRMEREEQYPKAEAPMFVTDAGMNIDFRAEQP